MKKSIVFILPGLLFLCLWAGGQDSSSEMSGFSVTDSIPHPSDSAVGKTCLDCHGSLVEKKIKHKTETDKGCADCHKSSSSIHPPDKIALLTTVSDLCLSCHEDTKTLIAESPYVHIPTKDKKSCTLCHSPHSSDVKKLLIAARKDLCLSCHDKPIKTETKTIANIGQVMKSSKVFHPPFENCSKSCHNPHASQDSRLLDFAFPNTAYVPYSSDAFALCWECHTSDMIETQKTTGATSFRNADTNLHYVHIHGDKARNCTICHTPHATNNEHLIKESVKFGNWEFRMNYISNENGGSCSPGCHTEKTYTR